MGGGALLSTELAMSVSLAAWRLRGHASCQRVLLPPPARPRPRAPPPGSSRPSQGPILSPAVLLPVCVAALLLPGGQPEPALLLSLHPGTGSLPSPLLCWQICLWLRVSPGFYRTRASAGGFAPRRPLPGVRAGLSIRAPILRGLFSEERVQSMIALAIPHLSFGVPLRRGQALLPVFTE